MSITLKASRRRKTTWAAVVTALAVVAAPLVAAAPATATQPEIICNEAGFETKVNTTGDPATVTYTAPEGYLVDAYCVKAGTTKFIIPVSPPSATVTIDHPEKDSVSHYQVRLIEAPKQTASASVFTTEANCEVGETLRYGTITGATFSGTPDGTQGPGSYTVTATALANYEFSPGVTVLEFSDTLDGPLDPSNPSCAPPPPVQVSLTLTYMQQKLCPGVTPENNEWRIRNNTEYDIPWTNNFGQSGVATPGDTFFYTEPGAQTMIVSWGGGDSGFVAGSTTKAGGQNITLPGDDPLCAEEPVLEYEAGDFGDCIEQVEGGFLGGAFAENSENSTEPLTFNLKVTNEADEVVYDESVEVAPGDRADLGYIGDEDTGVYTFTYFINGEEVGSFVGDSDCWPNEEEPGPGIVDVTVVSECKTRINQETGLVESYILVTTTLENLRVESDEPVRPTTFNYGASETELTEVTVGDDEILVVTEEFPAGYAGGEFDYLVGIKDGLGEFQYGEFTVNTEPCHDTEEPGDPTGDASVTCLTGGDVRIDWTGENPSDAEGNAVYDLIAFPLYESEQVVEPGGVLDAEITVSPTEVDYVELYLYGELLERIEVGDEFCGTEEPEEGEFVVTTTSKCLASGDTEVTVTGANTTDSVQTVRVGIEEDDTFLLEFDVPAGETVSETFVLKHGFGNGTATIYAGDANAPVAPQPVEIDTDNCPKPPVIPENPEKPEQPKPPVLATTGAGDLSGLMLLGGFALLGGLGLIAARRWASARA